MLGKKVRDDVIDYVGGALATEGSNVTPVQILAFEQPDNTVAMLDMESGRPLSPWVNLPYSPVDFIVQPGRHAAYYTHLSGDVDHGVPILINRDWYQPHIFCISLIPFGR